MVCDTAPHWYGTGHLGASRGRAGCICQYGYNHARRHARGRRRIEAEDYDTDGSGIAHNDATAGNSGGAYRSDDVDIEVGGDNYNVGWTDAGEWLNYSSTIDAAGTDEITAHVASAGGGGIGSSDSGPNVANEFHDFQIIWCPDAIKWFVDVNRDHTVTQSEVENAGNEWVFRDEFYVIPNVAVGGDFPGSPETTRRSSPSGWRSSTSASTTGSERRAVRTQFSVAPRRDRAGRPRTRPR